jgi:H+-transporting ATPase
MRLDAVADLAASGRNPAGMADTSLATDASAGSQSAGDGREGLSEAEAARRLQEVGPNELPTPRRSLLLEIGSHFWGPIPWLIEAAVVLTAAVQRWADFAVIAALLVLNGGVGFWEEHQAGSAVAALAKTLALEARVRRDGGWESVAARLLVPGDLVHVALGQIVPADCTVVAGSCEVDESALTGESLPIERNTGDDLHSGTVLVRGEATARVSETGPRTVLGRTAALSEAEPPPSHFQRAVLQIGQGLIVLAVALVAVIIVVSLLRGNPVSTTLEFALVVTIASVPVALPAVLSVTMAVGARELARKRSIVKHLPVVEELAGVDILCSDKTGTITQNRLTLEPAVVLERGVDAATVLLAAGLASQQEGADPIDLAILAALPNGALSGYTTLEFEPFDPSRKLANARIQGPDGASLRVAKGAPQAVAALVGDSATSAASKKAVAELAGKGFRTLGVARDDGKDWRLLGLLPLHDPPREDSGATIREAGRLGLIVKMITGDRVEIAQEVAREIGLGDRIVEASALRGDSDRLANSIAEADGFGQVVPEDKYRIVESLQGSGHIVAMTGDGVNDAPALRRADAGIAVAGATDAARAAADIVLLSPGLSVIVEALRLSREIFRRMVNYAIYRMTETIRIVILVTAAILAFGWFPVTASQIVLLAILNDAAVLSIAVDRVQASDSPERWEMRELLTIAGVLGVVGLCASFSLLVLGDRVLGLNHDMLRTLIYLKLSVAGHMTVFVARTRGPFWSVRPARLLLIAVVGTQILATAIAVGGFLMHPLPWRYAALAWGWAIAWGLVLDASKLAAYACLGRIQRHRRHSFPLAPPLARAAR